LVAEGAPTAAVLIVDEAAQLPVHLLQALVRRHPRAHLAFATTVHGYEGTGRGFALRFTPWLRGQEPAPMERTLNEAIRWSADDDLERAIFSTLLLDAEPAAGPFSESDPTRARMLTLDRDALVADPERLRALFGLLVQAHYRTTPGDLQRMLDAPNLEVHAAELDGEIVAVNLVAAEGEQPPTTAVDAAAGRTRLRAHALADVLVAHLGHVEAGSLSMRRSVRIAVHPQLRRTGLARRLIAFVHERHPEIDLFGTLFAATAEIIALRRRLGYEVVRVSASRGARSGEPSVMMLRPQSPSARALVAALRVELGRELDTQLELLRADEGISLAPALEEALRRGLAPPPPLTAAEVLARVRTYVESPRTYESMATALRTFVAQADLRALDEPAHAVVSGRVLAGRSWASVAADAGLSQPAAMRALRRAIRRLSAADETPPTT
ncbi:MAG: tRNA(Met) cytidine acetyltransferase, partial [Myxococcales bacterium]|nr:tRNA(Met) cytidine acetyltransferase [Myxococcales bacterium]